MGRGTVAALAAAALAAGLGAGCGSSDDTTTAAATGSSGGGTEHLKVASLAASAPVAPLYVAKAKGFFDDAGVDVDIQSNTGANTPNFIASGQADVAMMGTPGPLILAQRGKDTTIVATVDGGGAGGVLVGGKDVTSIDQLKGQRIGVLGQGTSVFGHATLYNQKYGLGADLVPFQDPGAENAALQSGRIAGAVGPIDAFNQALAENKAHLLIDTRDQEKRAELVGDYYPEGVYFGLTDNLSGKREAVQRFLAGVDAAYRYIDETDDATVAADLRTLPEFQTIPADVLAQSVKGARSYFSIDDVPVDPDNWSYALDRYAEWGIPGFKADDPAFAYDKRVDMSYLDAARDGEDQEG